MSRRFRLRLWKHLVEFPTFLRFFEQFFLASAPRSIPLLLFMNEAVIHRWVKIVSLCHCLHLLAWAFLLLCECVSVWVEFIPFTSLYSHFVCDCYYEAINFNKRWKSRGSKWQIVKCFSLVSSRDRSEKGDKASTTKRQYFQILFLAFLLSKPLFGMCWKEMLFAFRLSLAILWWKESDNLFSILRHYMPMFAIIE